MSRILTVYLNLVSRPARLRHLTSPNLSRPRPDHHHHDTPAFWTNAHALQPAPATPSLPPSRLSHARPHARTHARGTAPAPAPAPVLRAVTRPSSRVTARLALAVFVSPFEKHLRRPANTHLAPALRSSPPTIAQNITVCAPFVSAPHPQPSMLPSAEQ